MGVVTGQIAGEALARDSRAGHPGYRAHIDGLRAVAVTLVVLFHLGYGWMPGGFIGVDVFFVISGYLITGLLVRELRARGAIRMREFYARRVRRLAAAAVVVIGAVMVLSALLLDAVDRRSVGGDAVATALYMANWRFVAQDASYFTPGDVPSPLIHFWSLAIEEQFYLVWPALLLGLWKLSRRGRARSADRRLLLAILALLLGSALLSVVLVPSTAAYYGTHTRAYQLLTGAALVFLVGWLQSRVPDRVAVRAAASAGAAAALAAVVVLAVSIPDAFDYPGTYGLGVTAASAILLVALELAPAGSIGRLLGHSGPALLGRMSYSIYIWHWPILAFAPVVAERWNLAAPTQRWAQLSVIAVAASASYVLVERPVRFRAFPRAPARSVIAFGLATSALVVAVEGPLLEPRNARAVEVLSAIDDSVDPGRCPYAKEQWEPLVAAQPCVLRRGAGPVMALFGDSHALQWQPALEEIARRHDLSLLRVTRRGCPANWIDILYLDERGLAHPDPGCLEWRSRLLPRLVHRRPDVVFVATRSHEWRIRDGTRVLAPGQPLHLAMWARGWERTLRTLSASHAKVVVSLTAPSIPFRVPACLAEHLRDPGACGVPAAADRAVRPYNRALARVAARVPGVSVIDPAPMICPHGWCPARLRGRIVHRDDDHMTASFARSLVGRLETALTRGGARLEAGT